MKITVKLFGDLRRFLPQADRFKGCELALAEGASLSDVLEKLPVPAETAYMIIVNDIKVHSDQAETTSINSTDEIVLLPPIKGG